jgi:hypothetical protein
MGFRYLVAPYSNPKLRSFLNISNSVVKINVKCSGIYGGSCDIMLVAGVLLTLNTVELSRFIN